MRLDLFANRCIVDNVREREKQSDQRSVSMEKHYIVAVTAVAYNDGAEAEQTSLHFFHSRENAVRYMMRCMEDDSDEMREIIEKDKCCRNDDEYEPMFCKLLEVDEKSFED